MSVGADALNNIWTLFIHGDQLKCVINGTHLLVWKMVILEFVYWILTLLLVVRIVYKQYPEMSDSFPSALVSLYITQRTKAPFTRAI